MAIAAMLHNARLWNRCNDTASSDVSLSLRRSFELPSDSKWIGLSSSLTRRDEGPRMDPCRLPALRPASGKFARMEERARRKDKSRKRGASVRSKTRAASNGSKPRQPRPLVRPRATGRGLECPRDQDIRPKSSFSELSLPSPRNSRENEDILSASAVLRAALTGSFLDDESLELQLSSVTLRILGAPIPVARTKTTIPNAQTRHHQGMLMTTTSPPPTYFGVPPPGSACH